MKELCGASLVVQWLGLCTTKARGPGLIPPRGTRSHMLQLRVQMMQLNILPEAAKTWASKQTNTNTTFLKELCNSGKNWTPWGMILQGR